MEWISVKDTNNRPIIDKWYIIYLQPKNKGAKPRVLVAWLLNILKGGKLRWVFFGTDSDGPTIDDLYDVTHWMPIPEPPKEN